MNLADITVLILTYNEIDNIGRTLDALERFPSIVVVDSGSTDGTVEAISSRRNARVVTRMFDEHAAQWNFGLSQCPSDVPFVLALDADYRVTPAFVDAIEALDPGDATAGFRARFLYCVSGVPLRGSLYPPVTVLFRRDMGRYAQEGHTQRVRLFGPVEDLPEPILHDDRKPLSRWLNSQLRYASLEAEYILARKPQERRLVERIRATGWAGPVACALYLAFVKGCILDGWRGCVYLWQRVVAECLISFEIAQRKGALARR